MVNKISQVWIGGLAVMASIMIVHLTIWGVYFVATSKEYDKNKNEVKAIALKSLTPREDALPGNTMINIMSQP